MNAREWLDDIFDDEVRSGEKTFDIKLSEETSSQIQNLLLIAGDLENKGKTADAKKEYVRLGEPNGRQILYALMKSKGDTLLNALCGAAALGRMLEGDKSITLFSLSIILHYVGLFLKPKVIRSVLVLCRLFFYKNGARKTEAFSKGLGCSKNRTRKALEEVKENGLARPGEDGNVPGSGRPTLKSLFSGMMTGILLAVTGLDEAALEKKRSSRRIENRTFSENQDEGEIIIDIPTVDSVTTAFAKLRIIADDISSRTNNAILTAVNKQAIDLEMLNRNLTYAMTKLEKAIKEVDSWKTACTDNAANIDHGTVEARNNGNDGGPSIVMQAEVYAASLKVQILPQVLSQIIDLLTERCDGILEAFKETEGKNSYQLVKEAKRKARPKNLAKSLERLWADYNMFIKDIDVIAADHHPDNNTDTQPDKDPQKAAYDIKTADISVLLSHVVESLNNVSCKLMKDTQSGEAKARASASATLTKLSTLLADDSILTLLSFEEQKARFILLPMLHYLDRSCHLWQSYWENGSKGSQPASKAANAILSEGFRKGLAYYLNQLNDYEKESLEETTVNADQKENGIPEDLGAPSNTEDKWEKIQEEAKVATSHVQEMIGLLVQDLKASLDARKERRNCKESRIPEAIAFLEDISGHLDVEILHMQEKENLWHAQTLWETASWIREFLDGKLIKWTKDDAGKRIIYYTLADRIAASLCTKGSTVYINSAWEQLDEIYNGAVQSETEGQYIGMECVGATAQWFIPGTVLSPEARCMLVLRLWDQGKDPRDISTWIEYIVNEEYDRNYGDPSDRIKCCHISRSQLLTAFHCLTGITCSPETLWTIFTKEMGYSGRQCGKLDQVGTPSEHRDEQFRYIQRKREEADPRHTLVVSIDTKAFLLLGRLKHDNGKIMCRKDGRVYRVLDHDFALKLRQIYPNGTSLVDESRLDENAILRPVGAYCPQDGTGYVALVLGKDTAETMCNLLRRVIDIKRKKMPGIDRVLILADGGGANIANGVAWQAELLKLADDRNVTLDVAHLSPGCSKHNPVEHAMFSALSNNWKGKPFIDIEHVLGYVNSTRNKSLTVQGWFDTRLYQTNAEKKAAGKKVMTRAELDKLAGNRITHEFPEGEMYKWNYVVLPSFRKPAAA